MEAGDVFGKTRGAPGVDRHPRIVCSRPDADNQVLVFNVTDSMNESDHSCLFTAGEHEAFTKECVVKYRPGDLRDCGMIQTAIDRGLIRVFRPLSEDQLARLLRGLVNSTATKKWMIKHLIALGVTLPERENEG